MKFTHVLAIFIIVALTCTSAFANAYHSFGATNSYSSSFYAISTANGGGAYYSSGAIPQGNNFFVPLDLPAYMNYGQKAQMLASVLSINHAALFALNTDMDTDNSSSSK